jgi:hypothetical protein
VLTLLARGLFVWISLRRDRRVAAASGSKTT